MTSHYIIISVACLYRRPEFFYPGVFVEVKGQVITRNSWKVPVIYHSTHYNEMSQIIGEPSTAVFKGHVKTWRLSNTPGYGSYVITGDKIKRVTQDDEYLPGYFVFFGTKQEDTDMNGPCQFEFNFRNAIAAYHQSRGNIGTVCYKAVGSFVHVRMLYHVVLVCLEEDEACKSFPTITADSTAYFKPPTETDEACVCVNIYFIGQYSRHEHVNLAFYFPNSQSKFVLSSGTGRLQRRDHGYCVKTHSDCQQGEYPASIDSAANRWNREE